MKNKEILEEMKQYFKVKSIEDVAIKLGYKEATASTWRSRGISKSVLNKFELIKSNDLISDMNIVKKALNGKNNLIAINYYENIYASAGYGTNMEDYTPTKMEFDKNFLEKILNISKFDNLDIIRVIGDSMLPYIKDGEFILVERIHDAKSGDTIIASIEGELYVKRLKKVPFEKWLTLESENNEYSSIELDTIEKLEAFTIIGVMRSKIKLY